MRQNPHAPTFSNVLSLRPPSVRQMIHTFCDAEDEGDMINELLLPAWMSTDLWWPHNARKEHPNVSMLRPLNSLAENTLMMAIECDDDLYKICILICFEKMMFQCYHYQLPFVFTCIFKMYLLCQNEWFSEFLTFQNYFATMACLM